MAFRLNTDGTGFTNIHSFSDSDGAYPFAGLVLSENTLYGTTYGGGSSGYGTIFQVNTDGTSFRTLYNFLGYPGDGARPRVGLTLSGSNMYGTSSEGGSARSGTVFSISLAVGSPQLTIDSAGGGVVLRWPTNATGLGLQSTTNLASPVWTAVSPAPPVVVNGQYTITNPISSTQQFYRLSQ
jgi:uncharacterized repeat protein (TIGR03803 family)